MDLNGLLTRYKEAKDKIADLKYQARVLEDEIKHIPQIVLDEFAKTGVSSIGVDGVATFSVVPNENVFFPSKERIEDRRELTEFLKKHLGDEGFLSSLTVNYKFLTGVRKELIEAGQLKVEESLPGTVVTVQPRISITKKVKSKEKS